MTTAIEYIRSLQRNFDRIQSDNNRFRESATTYNPRTSELERENAELKHELHAAWTQLRQVEPNHPHVYGAMTGYLTQQQPQGGQGQGQPNVLPPLQQPMNSQWQNGAQPAAQPSAMQGVEFAGGRPYNHR